MSNINSIIETVNVFKPFLFGRKDYISCAVKAAQHCLNEKYEKKVPVGMLLSTAIFRDKHIVEPALSALILGDLIKKPVLRNSSFAKSLNKVIAFDVNNSACGTIQAIQIMDSYMRSGKIESGLVVAGDSAGMTGITNNYSFASGAAAILLSKGNKDQGFARFQTDTYHEYHQDSVSYSYFDNGKLMLTRKDKSGFLEHAVECASRSLEKFLDSENITPKDIDLLITSQHPVGFANQLCNKFGFKDKTAQPIANQKLYHTAAPLFALHSVFNTPRFTTAKNILFITVGAGITTSIALYTQ